MAFIITELVYICLGASWRTPSGAGISRCTEYLLVTFCCCLLYGRVVVSLSHSPFPFSILHYLSYKHTIIPQEEFSSFFSSNPKGCITRNIYFQSNTIQFIQILYGIQMPADIGTKLVGTVPTSLCPVNQNWIWWHYGNCKIITTL